MTTVDGWRPRVVVCGTGFGRVYLAALSRAEMPFELIGILAQGSQRSRRCAEHYGVPLYLDVDDLPSTVDVACVVVSAAINGGPGAELAQRLLARGVHVLQEHPLHQAELAACLRQAHLNRVCYHLNTHFVHLEPVRQFVEAARRLLTRQPALFIDALASFQVLYPLFDILAEALGGIRPWSLSSAPSHVSAGAHLSAGPPVATGGLRSLDGTIAGVPATLRVQHELHPAERDNGGHIAHRITLATEGGNLLLANPHGPVLWNPRLHMPDDYAEVVSVTESAAAHLDLPASEVLAPGPLPTYRQVVGEDWPRAAGRALTQLRRAIIDGEDPMPRGQRHLALCRLTAEVTARLGPPMLRHAAPPRIEEASALVTG